MNISCDISLTYETQTQARTIHQALSIDNDIYVKSKQEKNIVSSQIKSASISSFLHTLDDYLACVTVAETVMNKKH